MGPFRHLKSESMPTSLVTVQYIPRTFISGPNSRYDRQHPIFILFLVFMMWAAIPILGSVTVERGREDAAECGQGHS
jgi:hypothetical protein